MWLMSCLCDTFDQAFSLIEKLEEHYPSPVIFHNAYKYFTTYTLLLVFLLMMNLSKIAGNLCSIEGKRKTKFYMYSKVTLQMFI